MFECFIKSYLILKKNQQEFKLNMMIIFAISEFILFKSLLLLLLFLFSFFLLLVLLVLLFIIIIIIINIIIIIIIIIIINIEKGS